MSESKIIDARDTYCPGPLMEPIGYMKHANVGDELELLLPIRARFPISLSGSTKWDTTWSVSRKSKRPGTSRFAKLNRTPLARYLSDLAVLGWGRGMPWKNLIGDCNENISRRRWHGGYHRG